MHCLQQPKILTGRAALGHHARCIANQGPQLTSRVLLSHFELVYQRRVSDNPEILCKDFCLVRLPLPALEVPAHLLKVCSQRAPYRPQRPCTQAAHAEAFLILASSSPPTTWPARDSAPAAVAGVPLVPSTTFYLVLSLLALDGAWHQLTAEMTALPWKAGEGMQLTVHEPNKASLLSPEGLFVCMPDELRVTLGSRCAWRTGRSVTASWWRTISCSSATRTARTCWATALPCSRFAANSTTCCRRASFSRRCLWLDKSERVGIRPCQIAKTEF